MSNRMEKKEGKGRGSVYVLLTTLMEGHGQVRNTLSRVDGESSVLINRGKKINKNDFNLPFLRVMIEIPEADGVDGGVGGGFDLVALLNGGAVKRLRDGRWKLVLDKSNSLLILMSHGPVESGRDGGVTGGGGGLNKPSPEPRDWPPGGLESSYSSLSTNPVELLLLGPLVDEVVVAEEPPFDDPPLLDAVSPCWDCPSGGGVGGVDEESKKLRLKSEVVSKLTSVEWWWWWRPDPSTREPADPSPPWSILNTSIFLFYFLLKLGETFLQKVVNNKLKTDWTEFQAKIASAIRIRILPAIN